MNLPAVIIGAIFYAGLAVALGFLFVFFIRYFIDKEDAGDCFTTFITWLTFVLTSVIILMLPFDVICAPDSKLYMPIVWQIFMIALAVLVIILIPFTICFYEQDGGLLKRVGTGLIWAFFSIVVWLVLIIVLWAVIGTAEVSLITKSSFAVEEAANIEDLIIKASEMDTEVPHKLIIKIKTTLPVYAVCFISLIGWILFLIWGGCGMFTLPLDLILDFVYRPKKLTAAQYLLYKRQLLNKAQQLKEQVAIMKTAVSEEAASQSEKKEGVVKELISSRRMKLTADQKKQLRIFHEDLDEISSAYDQVRYVEDAEHYNVFIPWLKLILGCVFLLFALLWLLQVILCSVLQKYHFVSDLLVWLDKYVLFLGAGLYAAMILYMTLSILKGNILIGTKFFLISLYPMKKGATLPNALLFNGMLFGLAAFALIQFSATAFDEYVHNSAVKGLFVTQLRNMMGVKYVFEYVNYVFLGIVVLGIVFALVISVCLKKHRKHKIERDTRLKRI
ncbi:MAG: putative LIMR family protein [Streblomastix strix]|uniref:Putative LIMR family protein n=1 Tax=Streblomastix strix TaxID=222440 RepID=A0A5J4X3Y0_9EUKA|nr:MAG: putative LIMR family protein [Streblomastix strix]